MSVTCPNCGAGFSLYVLPGSTTFCPECRSQVLVWPAPPTVPASPRCKLYKPRPDNAKQSHPAKVMKVCGQDGVNAAVPPSRTGPRPMNSPNGKADHGH
jgi:DNA-directed RNA polymerase subunit RPC12/RpoP